MRKFNINAQALKAVAMAANKKDNTRPILMCVCIKPNEIAATDSYRINRYIFNENIDGVPEEGILFEASLFTKIKASQSVVTFEQVEDDKWIIDNATIAKPFEGNYPKYEQLYKDFEGTCDYFAINPDFMSDAMKAIKIVNGKSNAKAGAIVKFNEPLKPIRVTSKAVPNFEALIMPVRLDR